VVRRVVVKDSIQQDYEYNCVEAIGKNFDPVFTPELTPQQMLQMGVFGGWYLNDCQDEFPKSWFTHARLSDHGPDAAYNYFEIAASQPLSVWQQKGWIYSSDPRGWFQWYSRYYLGRRLLQEDRRQIMRWKAIKRHVAQLNKACHPGDLSCRRRQRQALLHWAYDSTKI
jgi:hypothetical protein